MADIPARNSNVLSELVRELDVIEECVLTCMQRLHRIKQWSLHSLCKCEDLPDFSSPKRTGHSRYREAIVQILSKFESRISLGELLTQLAIAGHKPHISTVKRAIKRLVREHVIDNDRNAIPPGYGLSKR